MIPLALGMAATIRVGFNVGAGDLPGARVAAGVALATTLAWGVVMAAILVLFRVPIVSLYTDNAEVIGVAAALLAIGALFQVFDAAQATTMGALRGYKSTTTPMMITVVAYWFVGLPLGAGLCFGFAGIPRWMPPWARPSASSRRSACRACGGGSWRDSPSPPLPWSGGWFGCRAARRDQHRNALGIYPPSSSSSAARSASKWRSSRARSARSMGG